MDADELKEAMAAAGKALADGIAANDEAKRETAEARVAASLRNDALRRVKSRMLSTGNWNRDRALSAVSGYCSQARADALKALKDDKRMPRTINYVERYNALLGMDDRFEMLRRLDQTISLAEKILDEAEDIDVDAALAEAAAEYADKVRRLDGIVIAQAEDCVEDETALPPKVLIPGEDGPDGAFEKAVEDAFLDAFGPLSESEERQAALLSEHDSRTDKLASKLEAAKLAAEKATRAAMHSASVSISGNCLAIPELPTYNGSVVLAREDSANRVRDLCSEVRKSFKTFKRVVQDNGLFAAFASEKSFGACNGWSFSYWWDDFGFDDYEYDGEAPGRSNVSDLPSDIEEDKHGDSLEKAIERMKAFNKRRYDGLFDDDFDEHVEAFWYGFKKLMENVNSLYRLNPAEFNRYCNELSEIAKRDALQAGAVSMDAHQVDEFCKDIGKLEEYQAERG